MLELKDFIKKTLVDIIDGVHEAGASLKVSGNGYVVPVSNSYVKDNRGMEIDISRQDIEFDIAVQVSESESKGRKGTAEGEVGGKIFVASAKGKIEGEMSSESEANKETSSRIKFTVPIGFKPTISC
jgi:hypothetical protein